jgi:hypothetical protein
MINDVCSELIAGNVDLLEQALTLLSLIDDAAFSTSPKDLEPRRVGSHIRHTLEFYDCFLNGLESSHVDYDARKHDETVARNRDAALERIHATIRRLRALPSIPGEQALAVRIEGGDPDISLKSSVGRELQALSSHTIHHFALIAVTLRIHGVEVDPNFGMSPSTLKFQAGKLETR